MTVHTPTMYFQRALTFSLAIALIGSVMLGSQSNTLGDTIVFDASRDNTLYEDPTGGLSNGAGQFMFAGRTGQTAGFSIRRGLVYFDVSSIPNGAIIDRVEVDLFMSKTISGAQNIGLHLTTADWGEGTSDASMQEGGGAPATPGDATWIHTFSASDFWTNVGGDFESTASATTSVDAIGSYTWGSTAKLESDVHFWLDNPMDNFGWTLVGDEDSVSNAKQFFSRENPNVASRPQLRITFTPIPEPACWVLVGLLGIASLNIRRRTS